MQTMLIDRYDPDKYVPDSVHEEPVIFPTRETENGFETEMRDCKFRVISCKARHDLFRIYQLEVEILEASEVTKRAIQNAQTFDIEVL